MTRLVFLTIAFLLMVLMIVFGSSEMPKASGFCFVLAIIVIFAVWIEEISEYANSFHDD